MDPTYVHFALDTAMITGIVFGAGILWKGHSTIAEEVKSLRESRHEHANILQRVVTMLDGMDQRVEKMNGRIAKIEDRQ